MGRCPLVKVWLPGYGLATDIDDYDSAQGKGGRLVFFEFPLQASHAKIITAQGCLP